MTTPPEIPPALTPDEWERRAIGDGPLEIARIMDGPGPDAIEVTEDLRWFRDEDIPALIALANAALPDTDPRKITRDWLADLRIAQNEAQEAAWRSCMNGEPGKPCDECQRAVDGFKARLQAIADALASYLPPETP
jgi:hypothetical protein